MPGGIPAGVPWAEASGNCLMAALGTVLSRATGTSNLRCNEIPGASMSRESIHRVNNRSVLQFLLRTAVLVVLLLQQPVPPVLHRLLQQQQEDFL
jgi:hypothetical protein